MKIIKLFILSVGMLALTNCNQKIDRKAEGEKLMQISREWSQSASSRDVEKTMSYWSDSAVVISAGEATRKGKEAIRKMVEGSYKDPNFNISWEPQQVDISESGDMGYLVETTTITTADSTGKALSIHFNSMTIWKKQPDGNWKNVIDVISPQ